MDVGGEWGNAIRGDFCTERPTKLHCQGKGAHLWRLERRNDLARGICNRVVADGRFSSKSILSEAQYYLNTLSSRSGYSVYQ